jgi:glycosyltransferase involved in cell wall biosynthesis
MRVLLIADAVSLPTGMASTQRLTLLARGLREAGAEVEILLLRATESGRSAPLQSTAAGEVFGIPFRYLCGSAVLARTRGGRRYQEILGLLGALRVVWRRSRQEKGGRSLVVITYSRHLSTVAPVGLWCRQLHIPVAAEMCEWPVTQSVGMRFGRWRRRLFCSQVTRFVDGVIPISRYIEQQVATAASRLRRTVTTCYAPILCDPREDHPEARLPWMDGPYVLFSASEGYRATVVFVLDAFADLLRNTPMIRLVITGIRPERNPWLLEQISSRRLADSVTVAGFISRPCLLTGYRHASALLIPLFDDALSRARFPTKICEYLLSGRPVVTSRVGEAVQYLEDGETARLAPPEDASAFAAAIRSVLRDPVLASRMGLAGRELAMKAFDYRKCGVVLLRWLQTLTQVGPVGEDIHVQAKPAGTV